jgi:uncharacterized protein
MADISLLFGVLVLVISIASGATASVVGFGIGSMLTPLLATRVPMAQAVAIVALPHLIATALRFVRLRDAVDLGTARRFGIPAALGGVLGGLAFTRIDVRGLSLVLALLLLATSAMNVLPALRAWRPPALLLPWLGGAAGFFGGLAGNQGGLRAAALATMPLSPPAMLATSTAIALVVDLARMPSYIGTLGGLAARDWTVIAIASVGCVVGTVAGEQVVRRVSRDRYRQVVAVAVGVLGVWLLTRAV